MKRILVLFVAMFYCGVSHSYAQRFLTDMMDTSTKAGKGNYPLYEKFDRLRFSGYMQPQFQYAEEKGAKSFNGGDFSPNSNNRFMLRRGRIRIDYSHFNTENQPLAYFAFQFDGTERGVAIRDFWGRFYENNFQVFALTMGMFARPMGYEVNLSSSDREAPERGRMSQTLMKTERDIGAMLTIEQRSKTGKFRMLRFELGVFNGQGLNGPTDYDSHKDVIGRFALKPIKINKKQWLLSGSTSGYYGGITNQSASIFEVDGNGRNAIFKGDSLASNINRISPRKYIGADIQLKIPNKKGVTEFRVEYIRGLQTGTAATSETPGTYPANSTGTLLPLYVRPFDGAYITFVQSLGNENLQAAVKYDWYDPNRRVKGNEITAINGFSMADIRYSTLGGGIICGINAHVKATLWYEWIENEHTAIPGYTDDLNDNVFTCRLQYRF